MFFVSYIVEFFFFDKNFRELNVNFKAFQDFKKYESDSLDILFLGSSHAKNSYNPRVFDSVFSSTSFNLGSAGQLLFVSEYLLYETIKTTRPKLVVIDLFPKVMSLPGMNKSKSYQLRVFDNTGFGLYKFNTINKVYKFKELPSVYSHTIRNHDSWHDLNWFKNNEYLLDKKVGYYNGYLNSDKTMNSELRNRYQNYHIRHKDFLSKKPNNKDEEYIKKKIVTLEKLISYCNANNIDYLFVSAPYYRSFYNDSFNKSHYALHEYFKDKSIAFIDFNKRFKELGLKLDDFSNADHVNHSGANKVSIQLAEIIDSLGYFKIKNRDYYNKKMKLISPSTTISSNKAKEINKIIQEGVKYNMTHTFTKNIDAHDVIFNMAKNKRYIAIKTNNNISQSDLKDYYFVLSGTIYKKDFPNRPKWNLGTDKDKLIWDVVPEVLSLNEKTYIILKFNKKCNILDFKDFKFYLKRNADKKQEGKTLTLNNIKQKKN